ncbi:CREB-binding protein-like [Haemaphysalis longicornis]
MTFHHEEFKQALMPILERLSTQYPCWFSFRQPVERRRLLTSGSINTGNNTVDLASIKRKLDTGQYQDPWQYVDDIWLIVSRFRIYNHKTTRRHVDSINLFQELEKETESVMKSLGYCCGHKFFYETPVLFCIGTQSCRIPPNSYYWRYKNLYTFCKKCFVNVTGEAFALADDLAQPHATIRKDQFVLMKNDHREPEPFVECAECGRKLHRVCVLHCDAVSPDGYICDNCLKQKGENREETKFTSKTLPTCQLGDFIQSRLNLFLQKESEAGEVTIRVLACTEKVVEVKPGMKKIYVDTGRWPAGFPYRAKALFAFQEIDGAEVCFFGMHVQEYGSECPPPNTRRVYIAYLDSVQFFEPRRLRTAVYHEILLGYLDYVKNLGFILVHIWACPPSKGDDYIFYCHPPDQKMPTPKKLRDWYKLMLDRGILEKIVLEYKDIWEQARGDKLKGACELPYFEGDFWPSMLEDGIKELEQEEEENRVTSETLADSTVISEGCQDGVQERLDQSEKSHKSGRNRNANKSKSDGRENKKTTMSRTRTGLSTKVYKAIEKYKKAFFVIRLHSAPAAVSLPNINDPDRLMPCGLMEGRDSFLTFAREKHYEFSSLRRAKYSSMALLYELHNQRLSRFTYTCIGCKSHVEPRHHCAVCDDFHLCVACYDREGHAHKIDLEGSPFVVDLKQNDSEKSQLLSFQRCIRRLLHAVQCQDANCTLQGCRNMKRQVQHYNSCKRKTNGVCPTCKHLIALCCYHAKQCQEGICPVPLCANIKHELQQLHVQHRLQQELFLRRRSTSMTTVRNRKTFDLTPTTIATFTLVPPSLPLASMPLGIVSKPPGSTMGAVRDARVEAGARPLGQTRLRERDTFAQ